MNRPISSPTLSALGLEERTLAGIAEQALLEHDRLYPGGGEAAPLEYMAQAIAQEAMLRSDLYRVAGQLRDELATTASILARETGGGLPESVTALRRAALELDRAIDPVEFHASRWVGVTQALPGDVGEPYEVIAVLIEPVGGPPGRRGTRVFVQDWVVRSWPEKFTHWMPAMPWPAVDEATPTTTAPGHSSE